MKMKKFNIFGVHWKIRFLEGGVGVHEKPIYRGRLPKKGGLGQFSDLRGGLDKKERGGVFDGGLIPQMHAMIRYASDAIKIQQMFSRNNKQIIKHSNSYQKASFYNSFTVPQRNTVLKRSILSRFTTVL